VLEYFTLAVMSKYTSLVYIFRTIVMYVVFAVTMHSKVSGFAT